MMKRMFLIVLDGVGIGAQWDARRFGDEGSNTLGNTARSVGGLNLPTLRRLGLGNIGSIEGVPPNPTPSAAFGKAREVSAAKDTLTGHHEMFGAPRFRPPNTYPSGFPEEIRTAVAEIARIEFLGNRAASGTVIIEEEGLKHLESGKPILYTSGDSVIQIAAHTSVLEVSRLHELCRRIAEKNTQKAWTDRVIARPFAGHPGAFYRLNDQRKDFTAPAPTPTALDALVDAGKDVIGVGKVPGIMGHRGFSSEREGGDHANTFEALRSLLREPFEGLAVFNFNDFDTVYGHRNDVRGFAQCLSDWDRAMGDLLPEFGDDDGVILTADHGNDPTTPSTDHSREAVPVLVFAARVAPVSIGFRETFADVGATICTLLGAKRPRFGVSFSRILGLNG
jgi:phosphopentomutase